MSSTQSPHILHSTTDVLSRRHMFSWLLIAFAAGAVNAGAFIACERFITHMTGIITQVGLHSGAWWRMAEYILVLAAFVLGAMASVIPLQGRTLRGKPPSHALPLWTVAVILAGIAAVGSTGVFGPIGGQLDEAADFALLGVIAFAMGLLNASVASTTALAVRTTHMTGPATDLGVHLATATFSAGEERRTALRLALLRGGKIAAYAFGAAAMLPFVFGFGHAAFLFPAIVIAVPIARSYSPRTSSRPAFNGFDYSNRKELIHDSYIPNYRSCS